MNNKGLAIAADAAPSLSCFARSPSVSAVPASIDYRAWPQGIFSPVSEGHTAASALATSLAFLRLYAADAERRGESTSAIRDHIASVEHLT